MMEDRLVGDCHCVFVLFGGSSDCGVDSVVLWFDRRLVLDL